MAWGCWEWPRQVTCELAWNTEQGKPQGGLSASQMHSHRHQGQVWVEGQAESMVLRPRTSPTHACPSFPSWLGETRAGKGPSAPRKEPPAPCQPGTTRAGAVSNKAASKMLSRLAAGKVNVSFLATRQPGRKASLAHLFPICILPSPHTHPTTGHPSLTRPTQTHLDHYCLRTTKQARGGGGKGRSFVYLKHPQGLRLPPAKSAFHTHLPCSAF